TGASTVIARMRSASRTKISSACGFGTRVGSLDCMVALVSIVVYDVDGERAGYSTPTSSVFYDVGLFFGRHGFNPNASIRTSGESFATISNTILVTGAGLEPTSPDCSGALAIKLPWLKPSLRLLLVLLDTCRSVIHLGGLPMCRSLIHTDS